MPEDETTTFHVGADSELARLMKRAKASGTLLVIDTGEDQYAVSIKHHSEPGSTSQPPRASDEETRALWANYDPAAALAAFRQAAGSWSDVDADELINNIYRWRQEGSRPANRP
jgi:hypothetical protein